MKKGGSSAGEEAVADAGFGTKVARAGGVIFEFTAELRHVDAEVLGLLAMLGAPNLDEQLALGDDLAGMADEGFEQAELDWREVDLGLAHADEAGIEIDGEVACVKGRTV